MSCCLQLLLKVLAKNMKLSDVLFFRGYQLPYELSEEEEEEKVTEDDKRRRKMKRRRRQ